MRRFNPERDLQVAVVGVLNDHLALDPEKYWKIGLLYHVPNATDSARHGAILKRMGVRSGVPDLILASPGMLSSVGLALELKSESAWRRKNKGCSPQQVAMHELLTRAGWFVQTMCSAEESITMVLKHINRS